MSAFYRLARIATRTAGGIERALSISGRVLREGTQGMLAAALERDERAALVVDLYESRLDVARSSLPAWERDWLERDLPAAPARILVGGAGEGREAIAIAERGYEVAAFEPGAMAISRCASALGGDAIAVRGTYEELSRCVLDGAPSEAMSPIADRRWDAILLGWTSVMHVLEGTERARLLAACHRLCPDGPILATFYPRSSSRAPGRAHRVGLRLGRVIGAARGVHAPGHEEGFGFGCGFVLPWTIEETEAIAAGLGRRALWRGADEGCLRVTLVRE